MSKKQFTAEDARAWIANMNQTHESIVALIQCSMWALQTHKSLWAQANGDGNLIDFKSKRPAAPPITMPPWPAGIHNFQQLGKKLDSEVHLINELLPEAEES